MTRIALILAAAVPLLAADVITLRDGTRYTGTFVGSSGRVITFNPDSGSQRTFSVNQVRSIEFDTTGLAQSGSQGVFADRNTANSSSSSLAGRTIPTGTELQVRTAEQIQSETATTDRTYQATVEADVRDSSGGVIIPRGSNADLVIRETSDRGAVGSAELVLDLQSVTVGGNTYYVSTEDVQKSGREGLGANRRTAEMVGGGAALGTLLGAIAGGGRGAAIGAAVGAAAGAGVQVLTRGKTVSVPAETVLRFRLDQPMTLQLNR
jgi:hypothetical protein